MHIFFCKNLNIKDSRAIHPKHFHSGVIRVTLGSGYTVCGGPTACIICYLVSGRSIKKKQEDWYRTLAGTITSII